MPASYRNTPPPPKQSEHKVLSSQGTLTTGVRKLINPTHSSRQLMREMSGLGMEDPIFGTTEAGPAHPSNIFDDMSLGDIAEDMRDMISVASDPIAIGGDGLDVEMFQASLGHLSASISAFSGHQLSLPSKCKATTKSASSTCDNSASWVSLPGSKATTKSAISAPGSTCDTSATWVSHPDSKATAKSAIDTPGSTCDNSAPLVSIPDSLPKLPIPTRDSLERTSGSRWLETSHTQPKVTSSAKLLIPLETSPAKPKVSSSEEPSRGKTSRRPFFRRGYKKL
jgi:hypothetical protein